jgi:hypothetical protein
MPRMTAGHFRFKVKTAETNNASPPFQERRGGWKLYKIMNKIMMNVREVDSDFVLVRH